MLGKAYDSNELREDLDETWNQIGHSKSIQQEATIQARNYLASARLAAALVWWI
jgi:hypothetical protein